MHFLRIENNNKDTLKHCGSYVTDGAGKTGCHLYDKELMANNKVSFVINGGGENRLINKFTVDIQRSGMDYPYAIFSLLGLSICKVLLDCTTDLF